MALVLIVNPELGWYSVVATFDSDDMTGEQFDLLEQKCEQHDYILIDWKSISTIESFVSNYE